MEKDKEKEVQTPNSDTYNSPLHMTAGKAVQDFLNDSSNAYKIKFLKKFIVREQRLKMLKVAVLKILR
jgi:hypothetical protein